jgi:hypothetical protein
MQCKATAVTEGELLSKEPLANAHEHLMPTRDINVAKIKASMKATVRVQHVGIKRTYDAALRELTQNVAVDNLPAVLAEQPEYDSIRSSVLRTRLAKYPPMPTTREAINFDGEYSRTEGGQRFLLHHDNNIVIFASDEALQLVSASDIILLDGTFNSSPALFYQLYTIHGRVLGQIAPLVYALLPNKEKFTYRRLFEVVRHELGARGLVWNPERILIDHELAALQALRVIFPGKIINTCLFHFCQCILRKVNAIGMKTLYEQNEEVRLWVRKMMAMALAPLPTFAFQQNGAIPTIWQAIMDRIPAFITEEMKDALLSYLWQTWCDPENAMFHPVVWTHYNTTDIRTTNNVEAWHRVLNAEAGSHSPNIYRAVQILKTQERQTSIRHAQLQNGGAVNVRRSKWIKVDQKIQRIKALYELGELPIGQFLRAMAYLV